LNVIAQTFLSKQSFQLTGDEYKKQWWT